MQELSSILSVTPEDPEVKVKPLEFCDVEDFISKKVAFFVEDFAARIMQTMISTSKTWNNLSCELVYNGVNIQPIICAKLFNNADFLKSSKLGNSFIYSLIHENIRILTLPNFQNQAIQPIGLEFSNLEDFFKFWSKELFANANIQSLVLPFVGNNSKIVIDHILNSGLGDNLKHLSLNNSQITDADILRIVESQLLSSLLELSVVHSNISNRFLVELAFSERLQSISKLNLYGAANVDIDGIYALGRSSNLATNSEFKFLVGNVNSTMRLYIESLFQSKNCYVNF